jgi:acylphosphatase
MEARRRRVTARVFGIVQGVCFRAEARREARRLGLDGWVRNRSDGSVELAAEGATDGIELLLVWCRHGPPHARVDRLEVDEEAPTGEDRGFGIAY